MIQKTDMKKKIYILPFVVFIILVISACVDRHKSEQLLDAAELLMESRPDSAFTMLSSVCASPDSLPKALRMRLELLKAKAQNKMFVPFTTDSTMAAVAEWYDRHGNRSQRMTAHYLLGCVYRDLNDAPMALDQYHEAVSLADTTAGDCDWHTLCRIHGQMGTLFNKMGSPEYELEEWENTYATAMKAKDTIMAFNAYALKAYAYFNMYKMDSVISITDNVVRMYEGLGRKDFAAGHLPAVIDVYLHRKKYDKAKTRMDYYERYSGFFDTDGNIEAGKESYYGTKARYYNAVGQADSAYMYLKKLIKFKDNIQCAEVAYRELMAYYENQLRADSVVKYARLFCRMNDSSAIVRSAEAINKAKALYNYNKAQQTAKDKAAEADNYRFLIICVICFAVIAIVVPYRMYNARMRRQRMAYTEMNRKYNGIWADCDKAASDLQMMESDFEKYKAVKENEIKELKKSISAYHDCCIDNDVTENERTLRNSEVVVKLHLLAAKGDAATEQELSAVIALTKNILPDFYNIITLPKYKLKEREIKVCAMIRLNFIPSEIAVLLNISLQRITNIRSCINMKLFKKSGTKELDSRLKMLK